MFLNVFEVSDHLGVRGSPDLRLRRWDSPCREPYKRRRERHGVPVLPLGVSLEAVPDKYG